MSDKLPDLSRTEAAIAAYDCDPSDELAAAVGAAYGEDTQDRNNPATCAALIRPGPKVPTPGSELSFVRRMVKLWREQP